MPLVLALDASGAPQRWINHEAASTYYAKDLIAWSVGEVNVTLYGGISRMTGRQSTLTMNTIIALRGKISRPQQDRANHVSLTNRTLFQRDRQICAYCGQRFSTERLTRDHVVPVSKGGPNVWENVVAACEGCNRHKDNRTPEQANMPLLFLPYRPNRAEVLILQNRKILADQMEFLITRVPSVSRLL
jgi:5-methylcytosine-specific restriction endonuclease McrA